MKTKRILACLLAAVLVGTGLTACGGTEPAVETTQNTPAAAETTPPETAYDTVPDLDFGGETFTMFVRTESPDLPEFYVEGLNGDVVNDAIYNRNMAVQERLNIDYAYVENESNWGTRTSWAQLISQSIMANDAAYDVAAGYSMAMANLTVANMLLDLQSTAYLDFTQPWWSDSLLNEATIGDKLYFASGDISTWMILYTYATAFNKDMVTDFGLEDIYTLVDEGKWTIDKMMSMSEGIYSDLNGNEKKDIQDRFGYAASDIFVDVFFFSSDLRTTSNAEGSVTVSPLFSSERAVSLLEKLCNFIHHTNDGHHTTKSDPAINYNFELGNTLFANIELQYAYTTLRSAEFNYGIVPVPKYDEEQKEYYTATSFPYTLYGIPLDAKNPDMTSAVIECLASESHRNVVPALFEVALKVKYSQDSNDARMYDIVRGSVVFDIGRIFCDNLDIITYGAFRDAVKADKPTWASICASKVPVLEKLLDSVFAELGN